MKPQLITTTLLATALSLTANCARAAEPYNSQPGASVAAPDKPQPSVSSKLYKKALPGYSYKFPADHYSHDEFKTEWWYYTGHLQAKNGKKYGYELTFFRTGPQEPAQNKTKTSNWNLDNFYLAHFAISDISQKKFSFYEKLNRSALGIAGARKDAYKVFNEGWSVTQLGDNFHIKADSPDYSLELLLSSQKPPVVHGLNGVSQKASCAGCASHYYSMTNLKSEGLLIDHATNQAASVTGTSWMDHEFGSNQLTAKQTGWDWFSLQLSDNRELMIYILRREDGSLEPYSSGTVIDALSNSRHLKLDELAIKPLAYWNSPVSKGRYPMAWAVKVNSAGLDLKVLPEFENQELNTKRSTGVTYWEGACKVSGTSNGKNITGQGYVEMTGYAEKFRKNI